MIMLSLTCQNQVMMLSCAAMVSRNSNLKSHLTSVKCKYIFCVNKLRDSLDS